MAAVSTIKSKPTAKEITYKNDEAGTHFDGFIYEGSNLQEKNNLGSLYVVGQVKYGEEDLAYLVNLISSLAKREYYADGTVQGVTAKASFEKTLKKLNEVLEDFFKNKEFKLTVGLAAIAGENIFISRLGNVRVALTRDDNYIDVINNIGLFNREHVQEKEFSNVISGKIMPKDKFFMYLPLRPIVSREKSVRELFKKEAQLAFSDQIESLSKTAKNFTCCGIHIEMNHVKEIPLEAHPSYYTTMALKTDDEQEETKTVTAKKSRSTAHTKESKQPATASLAAYNEDEGSSPHSYMSVGDKPVVAHAPEEIPTQPRIISADVSLVRRKGFITKMAGFWTGSRPRSMMPKTPKSTKMIAGTVVGLLVVILAGYFLFFRSAGPESALIKQASADVLIVKDEISKGDYRAARSLGYTTLTQLIPATSKKAVALRDELSSALKAIDKASDKIPTLLSQDLSQTPGLVRVTAASEGLTYVISADGAVFSLSGETPINKIGDVATKNSRYLFDSTKLVAISETTLAILNKGNGKTDSYTLSGFETVKDATLYEGNIYALSVDSILKYQDVITTEAKPAVWGKDIPSSAQSITVDGNIYLLSGDGKVSIYFKGTKQSEYDLALTPSSEARIFVTKGRPFLYYVDRTANKIMVFDKSNGELQTSFSLDNIGAINDISIGNSQAIYILSSDNKLWSIK